jgi:hypothetical protein
MTNDVDLAFAAAERAGTLRRVFLRVRDARRVLAKYQRVMRMIFGYATDVGRRPGGNPCSDGMIVNRIPQALPWAARDPNRPLVGGRHDGKKLAPGGRELLNTLDQEAWSSGITT